METQLIRMTAEEAVTLTKAIEATSQAAVKEHDVQTVNQQVVDAVSALSNAAKPLAKLPTVTHEMKMAVDGAADSILAGIHNGIQACIQVYSQSILPLQADEVAEQTAAVALAELLFPDGTSFLKDNWYHQYGATDMLVSRATQPAAQKHISLLKLENQFGLLKRIHTEYGERMGFSASNGKGNSALDDWYEALEQYMATVTVNHKRGSVLRNTLHEPYMTLENAIRERRRKARQAAAARREKEASERNETTQPSE